MVQSGSRGPKNTRKLEVFVVGLLKNTRKLEVLVLRGRPKDHKSEKNTTKLEMFVVGLLKHTRKHEKLRGFNALRPFRGALMRPLENTRKYYILARAVSEATSGPHKTLEKT